MICIEKRKMKNRTQNFQKKWNRFYILYTPSLQNETASKINNTLLFRFVSNFYSPEEKSRKLDDRNAFREADCVKKRIYNYGLEKVYKLYIKK